ncbi:MAG: FAD-binding oxidoreductase [Gammaproteobacteria bacterium]
MTKWWGWGIIDKSFEVHNKPSFWPFVTEKLGVDPQRDYHPWQLPNLEMSEPILNHDFVNAIKKIFDANQFNYDKTTRIAHAFGKSYRDLYRARTGAFPRIPDMVIYPHNHQQVVQLMELANQYRIILIPFGGGTNIVGAVEACPTSNTMVLTVNLRRMNKLLHIDPYTQSAVMQAGMLGPEIEQALNPHGFTLGHFPDSFEFSTLGGWIATRSAGMQSDKFGNIEDMTIALKIVTPKGVIISQCVPRQAAGPDFKQLMIGSEGCFGIITEATMQITPLRHQQFRGLFFKNFELGISAIQEYMTNPAFNITMLRLSNEIETALGLAMQPKSAGLKHVIQKAFKHYVKYTKNIELPNAALMMIGLTGTPHEIHISHQRLMKTFKKYQVVDLGEKIGKRWSKTKYDYPYLRDYLMDYGLIIDVTETSINWSNVEGLYQHVKTQFSAYLSQSGHPQHYLGCHVSHSYHTGACLYFTFAFCGSSGDELAQYLAAKHKIVSLIVEYGGALSHHHAIGYEHLPWYQDYIGKPCSDLLTYIKNYIDPVNLCNPGKLLPEHTNTWFKLDKVNHHAKK